MNVFTDTHALTMKFLVATHTLTIAFQIALQALIMNVFTDTHAFTTTFFVVVHSFTNAFQMSKLNNLTQIKIEKLIKDQLPSFAGAFIKAKRNCMKESSLHAYAFDLSAFFEYISKEKSIPVKEIGIDDFEDISASDIENYVEYSKQYFVNGTVKKRSDAAVFRRYIILKSFYNFLYSENMIDSLEILKASAPKPSKKAPIIPSQEENMALINFISNENLPSKHAAAFQAISRKRDVAIIALIICAGLKISECEKLNIDNLHLDEGYIIVNERRYPKITISDYVRQCISEYLVERIEMIPVYGEELALFLSIRGSRLSVRSIEYMIKKYSSTLFGNTKCIVGKDLHTSFRNQVYNMSKSLSTTALLSNCTPETLRIFYKAELNERTADTAQL